MPAFKKNYSFECSDCACPTSSSESINNKEDNLIVKSEQKRIRKNKKYGENSVSDFEQDDLDSTVASRRKSRKRRSALESVVSRIERTALSTKKVRISKNI